jgi:hypothetical protein
MEGLDCVERGSDVANVPLSWMWPHRLPSASLCLLEGKKGSGKSSIAAAICAAVTGGPRPPGWPEGRPRNALWSGAEESYSSVISPRLIHAGCDPARFARPRLKDERGRPKRLSLPSMLDELRELLKQTDAGLLVLDPFSSLADPLIDLRQEQPARSYLEPLADLLWEMDCVALLTRHLRKGGAGDALDQGLGSVAVGNTARSVLRADTHPVHDGLHVLSLVACNATARPPSLIFRIEVESDLGRVAWQGESNISADILAEGKATFADRDESRDARRLLRAMLAAGGRQAGDIAAEALAAGIQPRMLRRAKAELRVISERKSVGDKGNGCWLWLPPAGGFPAEDEEAAKPTGGGIPAPG